jgi:hypothetical protein
MVGVDLEGMISVGECSLPSEERASLPWTSRPVTVAQGLHGMEKTHTQTQGRSAGWLLGALPGPAFPSAGGGG